MASNNGGQGSTEADPPSVLFFAPGSSEAETLDTALSRHGVSVSIEYDIVRALEDLPSDDVECIVVSDTLSSISSDELFDAVRERDPDLPVVFLLTGTPDSFMDRLDRSDTADYVTGDVGSVSYGRLADCIRAAVATYRSVRARHTERDITERLTERLHRTERKITALHSVAMELNTTKTADGVYQETVAAAEDILDLDICFAFTAEDDTFVPKAQSSTPTDRELGPVPIDAGAMGETYRTGESFRVVDMDLHALADPEFGDYQSGISVPIGKFGVFQAVSEEAGAFDGIDLELTELLTSHAASAIKRLSFEQELRTERDRYAALFRNSSDCILEAEFVDGDAIIRRINPAFEATFGYDASDLVGRDVDDAIVSEDRYDEAREITNQVRDGETVQTEVRRRTSDGLRDFLLRSVPVDDDSMYGVYTDITEQKETERTIERQKERLDQFASVVSHDLRNPLHVAKGRLELVQDETAGDDEDLAAIETALDRMEALLTDLLVLAREGDIIEEGATVDLADIAEAGWQSVETAEAVLVVETDRTVRVDPSRLQQLLENLFRNAVDHAGESVTVTVGDIDGGFFVSDDGRGIPAEDREEVFDAGYSTGDSTGFGLQIVEEIVDAHGWTIRVTDSNAGGAKFEITGVETVD